MKISDSRRKRRLARRRDRFSRQSLGRLARRSQHGASKFLLAIKTATAGPPSKPSAPSRATAGPPPSPPARGGNVAIAWDTYEKGDYDIWVREFDKAGKAGEARPAANTPDYEARPALTYDKEGSLWIAYEESGASWGKDWSGQAPFENRDGIGLYQDRQIGLAVLKDGKWTKPRQLLANSLPGADPRRRRGTEAAAARPGDRPARRRRRRRSRPQQRPQQHRPHRVRCRRPDLASRPHPPERFPLSDRLRLDDATPSISTATSGPARFSFRTATICSTTAPPPSRCPAADCSSPTPATTAKIAT